MVQPVIVVTILEEDIPKEDTTLKIDSNTIPQCKYYPSCRRMESTCKFMHGDVLPKILNTDGDDGKNSGSWKARLFFAFIFYYFTLFTSSLSFLGPRLLVFHSPGEGGGSFRHREAMSDFVSGFFRDYFLVALRTGRTGVKLGFLTSKPTDCFFTLLERRLIGIGISLSRGPAGVAVSSESQ